MGHDHPCVSARNGHARRRTALLVDDDIFYRQVISEVLTDEGWDVVETSTGEDALRLLDKDAKPAALVTDINLGDGMDGWALGGLARNQWPDIGLLFISGENQSCQQSDQAFLGIFLSKPFLMSDFLAAFAEVVRSADAKALFRSADDPLSLHH